nr:MAG TPA: hypothetical protein [Caudoviricetes sp.]
MYEKHQIPKINSYSSTGLQAQELRSVRLHRKKSSPR